MVEDPFEERAVASASSSASTGGGRLTRSVTTTAALDHRGPVLDGRPDVGEDARETGLRCSTLPGLADDLGMDEGLEVAVRGLGRRAEGPRGADLRRPAGRGRPGG